MRRANTKLTQFVTIVTLVFLFGDGGLLFGQDTLTGGPYAENPNNPNSASPPDPTRMNIVWYTAQDVPSPPNPLNCKIEYRVSGSTSCAGATWCTACCSNPDGSQNPMLTIQRNFCTGSTPCLRTRYEMKLTGLQVAQLYEYRVWGNGTAGAGPVLLEPCAATPCNPTTCPYSSCTNPIFDTLANTTTPPPPYDFTFFVFGDSGSVPNDVQKTMADTIRNLPQIIGRSPSFGLHVGDIIYANPPTWDSGSCLGYPTEYFQPYHGVIRALPFWTAMGNHDSDFYCPGGLCCPGSPFCSNKACPSCSAAPSPAYLNVFTLPNNGPPGQSVGRNYFFDYGNARFITIDSNAYRTILQNNINTWLNTTLTTNPQTWKFVFFHHSPYSSGDHGVDPQFGGGCAGANDCSQPGTDCQCTVTWLQAAGSIVDTMKDKVDILFTGHDHNFEFIPAQRGVKPFYIVTGMGGAGLGDARTMPVNCQTQTNRSCFTNGIFYGTNYNCEGPGDVIPCPTNHIGCSYNGVRWVCPGDFSFTVVDVLNSTNQVRVRQMPYNSTVGTAPILDRTFNRQ